MEVYSLEMRDLFSSAGLGKKGVLKTVVLPDKHWPHYCVATHEATLQFVADYKPHVLISIGDWWEMGPVSHWQGNINFEMLRDELDGGLALLEGVANACGRNLIYKGMLLGNHELWYKKVLSQQAPGLRKFLKEAGMDIHFANVAGLTEAGYDVLGYNEVLDLGDTLYTHGMYTNVHHAKKHADVMGKTVLYGHTETQQLHTVVNHGGAIQGVSFGTQRDESRCEFLGGRPTSWVTALGFVEYRADGKSTIYNPRIIDGVFSFGGKIYGN